MKRPRRPRAYRLAKLEWEGWDSKDPKSIPDDALLLLAHEVVETESPVHIQEVGHRIMTAGGRERAGTLVPGRIEKLANTKNGPVPEAPEG